MDVPQKVCQSCYENDTLISKTVTGDIYMGSFKFNYCIAEDMEVLTDRGFMSRAEVFAACPELAPPSPIPAMESDDPLPLGGAVLSTQASPVYWTPSPAKEAADKARGIRYEAFKHERAQSAVQLRDSSDQYGRQCGVCGDRVWSSTQNDVAVRLSSHVRRHHAAVAAARGSGQTSVTTAASSAIRRASLSIASTADAMEVGDAVTPPSAVTPSSVTSSPMRPSSTPPSAAEDVKVDEDGLRVSPPVFRPPLARPVSMPLHQTTPPSTDRTLRASSSSSAPPSASSSSERSQDEEWTDSRPPLRRLRRLSGCSPALPSVNGSPAAGMSHDPALQPPSSVHATVVLDTRSPLQQQPSPFGPGFLLAKSQDADGDALRVNGGGHGAASQSATSTPPLLSSPPSSTASPPISVAAAAPPASVQQPSVSVVNVTAQPPPVNPLRFASLDPSTGHLVYLPATALTWVTVTSLVEFTHAAEAPHWAADADEYGLTPIQVKRMRARSESARKGEEPAEQFNPELISNGVSLVVDRQHDMYVRVGMARSAGDDPHTMWASAEYAKVKAGALLCDDDRQRVRMTGHAPAGLAAAADDDELPFAAVLGLVTAEQVEAFLLVYGYWCGDGFLDSVQRTVGFSPKKDADKTWLTDRLTELGLTVASGAVAECDMVNGQRRYDVHDQRWVDYFFAESGPKDGVASITSSRPHTHTGLTTPLPKSVMWFWAWVWRLRRERARLVLAGLRLADGSEAQDVNVIFTSAVHFRDDIVRLALHAGYSARFSLVYKKGDHRGNATSGEPIIARHDNWVVAYTDHAPAAEPVLHNHRDIGVVGAPGGAPVPVWCPTVPPHNLIIARRVRRNAQGVVTQASRPIVVGNCWGKGVYLIQTKKERYEGDFDEGRMEGRGSYLFSNHDVFTGDYVNDKRQGRGTLQYRLNGVQQLQEDLELTLSTERRKQQQPEDRDPNQQAAIDAVVRPLTASAPTYPAVKGDVLYAGDWANDLPHGHGIFVTTAVYYVGDFVSGERTGAASIVMKATGERYDGAVRGGVRDGHGTMASSWGVYKGQWRENQRSGLGRWEYSRKAVPSWSGVLTVSATRYLNVYTGQFVADQATGVGEHVYWDGSHYQGGHLQLLPHGRGVMTYSNHDQFVGDWLKGQRHGQGKMVYSTRPPHVLERVDREGQVVPATEQELREAELMATLPRPIFVQYEGEWANDRPHGRGECLYPDGAVYVGQFALGQATGQGRTVYSNGDRYEGAHVAGIREGRGVYTWKASGNAYDGRWKAGVRFVPEYTAPIAGGIDMLDDTAHWTFLHQHQYSNAGTGERYQGESLYGDVGQWAKSSAQKLDAADAAPSASSPSPAAAPHPSTPDSPSFVRHGLGVLRAPATNAVYSHWMGEWSDDLRHGLGRLFLLASSADAAASPALQHRAHVVEGLWSGDQPPHIGTIQSGDPTAPGGYSFHGLLSASILPIEKHADVGEMAEQVQPQVIALTSSIDLHTWSRLTLSRLQGKLARALPVSVLSTPSSAAFVDVNVPLSAAFALSPCGVGTFRFPLGDVYHGQLFAGKAQGRGQCRYLYPGGGALNTHQVYLGQWHAGRREGLGQLVYADGSEYLGFWKEGERSGLGVFTATLPPAAAAYTYEGEWAHDRPNGRGTLRCPRFVYEGELQDGLMHGHGRVEWADGDRFNGQWRRGRREGPGHLHTAEDHTFLGALWYGRYHGYGTATYSLTLPSQIPPALMPSSEAPSAPFVADPTTPGASVTVTYTGDYYYGYKTGMGRLTVIAVDRLTRQLLVEFDYVGGFQGDAFAGSGVFSVYKASASASHSRALFSRYDGEWLSGHRWGTGQQWFSDGRIYTGEWLKDHPHGAGRMQYPLQHDHSGDGERDALPLVEVAEYTGSWHMGVRRGSGAILYSNGDSYTGEIADNHRHGSGALTMANGDTAKGVWKDDKKDGRLVYTFYRPVQRGGKTVPPSSFPPSSSSPLHYLQSVESAWKEDVLDGVVLFRFLPSTTAYLTAIHMRCHDGLLSVSHPFQVVYAEPSVYQGQLVATTPDAFSFDLYQLAEMSMQKSNPAVLSASTSPIPSFEDCCARLAILASLGPVFPVTGAFFPFHIFAVVFCHTRVSRHGVGLLRTSSGEEYVGQWKNNLRHGRGQQVFVSQAEHGERGQQLASPTEEQSVYVGSWQDDLMHGRGSLYIESRQVKLTTMFARGKANTEIKGKGRLEDYAQQSVYAGDLSSLTILNGVGQLVYHDGSSYQGTFVNGQPEGLGRKIEGDGSVHIGYYLRGQRWGKGMSVTADGVVEKGSWVKDKREGMFLREKAGQVHRVKYVDGVERWTGR